MPEQRELSGVLNRNDRKENDRHPDYKGSCTINGEHFWVSGWLKQGAKGTFLSLGFTAKDDSPKRLDDDAHQVGF